MPNFVKSLGDIEKSSSGFSVAFKRFKDFICDREKLVNGRVSRAKPRLMLRDQLVVNKKGIHSVKNNFFENLAKNWEQRDWAIVRFKLSAAFLWTG